jgi:hypothetical protein
MSGQAAQRFPYKLFLGLELHVVVQVHSILGTLAYGSIDIPGIAQMQLTQTRNLVPLGVRLTNTSARDQIVLG